MRTAVVCVAMALAVLGAAVPAGAGEKPALTDNEAAIKKVLDTKRVSFDFVDTPIRDVCSFLRQLVGVNLVLDPAVDPDRTVTLKVQDMKLGTAFQWVAKIVGATMEVKDGAIYVGPEKLDPKVHARVRELERALEAERRKQGPLGRIELRLGKSITVEVRLDEDMLGPETRELLRELFRHALREEVRKLKVEKGQGKF